MVFDYDAAIDLVIDKHYEGKYFTIDDYLLDRHIDFDLPILGIDETFFNGGRQQIEILESLLSFVFDIYDALPNEDKVFYWRLGD